MPLKLVYSALETSTSKKKMLHCELRSVSSSAPRRISTLPIEQLRVKQPDLAAIVDDIIAIYLEES